MLTADQAEMNPIELRVYGGECPQRHKHDTPHKCVVLRTSPGLDGRCFGKTSLAIAIVKEEVSHNCAPLRAGEGFYLPDEMEVTEDCTQFER